jgi:hypothetical protein
MTRTRWLLAWTAVLVGSTVWAQEPSPARDCRTEACGSQNNYPACPIENACPPQATEAARAPYYSELPQILFPVNFVDSGTCESNSCEGSCGPRDHARHESVKHRLTSKFLAIARYYYRMGHYASAEFMAKQALKVDPTNVDAQHAASLASLLNCLTHKECGCEAEECEANNETPTPGCGMCGCLDQLLKKALATKDSKPNCACANECKCCQDPTSPCECGEKCPCKKPSQRQRVSRVRDTFAPAQHFISVPVCCPGVPAQCPMVCPMPPQVMTPPAPGMMCICPPGLPACPMPPGATTAQIAVPEPVPMPAVSVPEWQVMTTATNKAVHRTHPVIRINVRDGQVHVSSPSLDASCDSLTPTPGGRALLEGNVCVTFHGEKLPAKICADCAIVDLDDGSYEVNPASVVPQLLRQTKFKMKGRKFDTVKPASCVCPSSENVRKECVPGSTCDRPCNSFEGNR